MALGTAAVVDGKAVYDGVQWCARRAKMMFADADLQWRWCCSGVRRGCNGGCESGSSMEAVMW